MSESDLSNSASGRVYIIIRQAILDRTYRPEDRLSRSALAKAYGTSQTPVREALLRLEREGFVHVKPRSGTEVAPIDPVAVHGAHFLRRALEVDVVGRLAKAPDVRDLSGIETALEANASQADTEQDLSFHRALFSALGMEALLDQLQPVLGPLHRCHALRQSHGVSVSEHRRIFDLIKASDATGAVNAMAAHLVADIEDLERLRRGFPDMFAE